MKQILYALSLFLAPGLERGGEPQPAWRLSAQAAGRTEVAQEKGSAFWVLLRNLTPVTRVVCVDVMNWEDAGPTILAGGGIGLSPHDACQAFERRNRVMPGESLAIAVMTDPDATAPITFRLEFRDLGPAGDPRSAVSYALTTTAPQREGQ